MIEAIHIRNFRTQKKINVDLSPTVTTIIGESAEGKSTILRALRYAALNKPAGEGMINWDAEKVIVRIFTNDDKVVRIRSKSVNKYLLNTKRFVAFGNDVPAEISQLLNLSDINFQGQFERHFWFCETAGEVSRQLNKIIDLSVIDRTLSNIAGMIRDTNAEIKLTNKRLLEAQTHESNLKYVEAMVNDLANVEDLQKRLETKAVECSLLADLLKRATDTLSTKKIAGEQATELRIIVSTAKEINQTCLKHSELLALDLQITETTKRLSVPVPDSEPLDKMKDEYHILASHIHDLNHFVETIKSQEEYAQTCIQELSKCKKQFAKATEGKCPICGNQMK